ncbi:acyl carrier protein [Candidatus Liberibacter africanus]|nr:acyl carrier protein [Candidatus Liberibacter africanus]QTP64413.1 acyl carrier protein [Candidatus Liberibacter africanus]
MSAGHAADSFTEEYITQTVYDITQSHLGKLKNVEVTKSSRFIEDLGADSLDTVELVMNFEEEFEIDISEDNAKSILTIGDAIDFIKKACEEKREKSGEIAEEIVEK